MLGGAPSQNKMVMSKAYSSLLGGHDAEGGRIVFLKGASNPDEGRLKCLLPVSCRVLGMVTGATRAGQGHVDASACAMVGDEGAVAVV